MKTIKIYHSFKNNIGTFIILLGFVLGSLFILYQDSYKYMRILFIRIPIEYIAWLGIIFFGGYGLLAFFLLLKPYLEITEYCVVIDDIDKKKCVYFKDVQSFLLKRSSDAIDIGIQYKVPVNGQIDTIPAGDISIPVEDLCLILNNRLLALNRPNYLH